MDLRPSASLGPCYKSGPSPEPVDFSRVLGLFTWFIFAKLVPHRFRSTAPVACFAASNLLLTGTNSLFVPLLRLIHGFAFLRLYVLADLHYLVYRLSKTTRIMWQEIIHREYGKSGQEDRYPTIICTLGS